MTESAFLADLEKSSPSSVLVVMDDNGGAAELVIQNIGADYDDGSKESIRGRRTKPCNSLLDEEQEATCTATPNAKSLTRRSSAQDTWCCVKLEGTIEALLSRPSKKIDWQLWSWPYHLGLEHSNTTSNREDAKKTTKKALQNRAFSLKERCRRMNQVRREQSPFGFTPTRKKKGSPLKVNRSFNLVELSTTRNGPIQPKKRESTNISSLTAAMTLCGCNPKISSVPDHSPAIIRSSMLEAVHEDICYDSDPEDLFARGQSLSHLTRTNDGSPGNNKENTNSSIAIKITDSEVYLWQAVQEFLNERFTLILHTTGSAPRAVKAWFERGQYLNSCMMQPRFCWMVLDLDHTTKSSKRPKRQGCLNVQKASSIDLVDVCRVLAVEQIEREHYPFAKASHCFLIKTLDMALLFEAKTKEDRAKIVRWMKVTVSRLASKLITGDDSLFEEFFLTGMIGNGPGEAPAFL